MVPLYFILYMIFCLGCQVKQGVPDEGWQYMLLSFSQASFSSRRINQRPQIREASIWAESSLSIQTSSLEHLCKGCSSIQAFNHCLWAAEVPFVITTFFPAQVWGKMSCTCVTWENWTRYFSAPPSALSTNQLEHSFLRGVVSALSYALHMPLFCQRIACFHSNDSHAPTLSTSR